MKLPKMKWYEYAIGAAVLVGVVVVVVALWKRTSAAAKARKANAIVNPVTGARELVLPFGVHSFQLESPWLSGQADTSGITPMVG